MSSPGCTITQEQGKSLSTCQRVSKRRNSWPLLAAMLILAVTGIAAAPVREEEHSSGNSAQDLCPVKLSNSTESLRLLAKALQRARYSRDVIVCITNEWLDYSEMKLMASYINETRLHHLNLVHPLQNEVSQVAYANEGYGRFTYNGTVGEPNETVPKIIGSLKVLDALLQVLYANSTSEAKHFTHIPIHQGIARNYAKALEVAHLRTCPFTPSLVYNQAHPALRFAAYMEAIKVLTIMEHFYEQMLPSQREN